MTEQEWYLAETQGLETLRADTVRRVEEDLALARASNPEIWAQVCARNPWEALEAAECLPSFVDPEEAPRGATEWLQSVEGQEALEVARMGLFWEAQK